MSDDLFFAAEIDGGILVIDLHAADNIPDALEQLEKKLFFLFNNGILYSKVIHGIGSGRLAEAVHEYLDRNPLVKEWRETEQGGSCIIIF